MLRLPTHRAVWKGACRINILRTAANDRDPVQIGPIYVLASIAAVILWNLGKRREGEASAYSIFNEFRELPGQLNAGVLDDQIRRGQMG